MIRRLTIKIVAVVLGTLLSLFAALLLVLNISLYQTSVRRTDEFMALVAENDGFFLPSRREPGVGPDRERRGPVPIPEMMRQGRFFYVKTENGGGVVEWNLDMMFDFSMDDAQDYINEALSSGRAKGTIENFNFLRAEKPYGYILVFAERSIEIGILEQLTRTSIWAAGIVSLILLCLTVFLARWMVKPVKAAFDSQKRFISDASHELKTPLTIISANADVLSGELGENQRVAHIKAQAGRMSVLIHDLLTLAKTDEEPSPLHSEFDLSKAVLETVLEFECQAFDEGKVYGYQIAENLKYTGDEKQLKQLTGILVDNAIRYSDEHGEIRVTLQTDGARICLSVYNSGIGVSGGERDRIFERFYRSDQSRSREYGGYGVGLSIAKAIAESNKAKIGVTGEYGKWVRFDVLL